MPSQLCHTSVSQRAFNRGKGAALRVHVFQHVLLKGGSQSNQNSGRRQFQVAHRLRSLTCSAWDRPAFGESLARPVPPAGDRDEAVVRSGVQHPAQTGWPELRVPAGGQLSSRAKSRMAADPSCPVVGAGPQRYLPLVGLIAESIQNGSLFHMLSHPSQAGSQGTR